MADYAKMYKVLFSAVAKAIEDLQKAHKEAEEIYISADDTPITLAPPNEITNNESDS
jgi:hypothetical protein